MTVPTARWDWDVEFRTRSKDLQQRFIASRLEPLPFGDGYQIRRIHSSAGDHLRTLFLGPYQ